MKIAPKNFHLMTERTCSPALKHNLIYPGMALLIWIPLSYNSLGLLLIAATSSQKSSNRVRSLPPCLPPRLCSAMPIRHTSQFRFDTFSTMADQPWYATE
jgi:hypothetical protein